MLKKFFGKHIKNNKLSLIKKAHDNKNKESLPHLFKYAQEKDSEIKVAAFDAIIRIAGNESILGLIDLSKNTQERIHRSIVNAIGIILCDDRSISPQNIESACDTLKEYARNGSYNPKSSAILWIGRLGRSDDLNFIASLANDHSPDIRQEVATSLGRINPLKGLSVLLNLMSDDNLQTSKSAALSILKIESHLEEITKSISNEWGSRNDQWKIGAINILKVMAEYGDESAKSLLRSIKENEEDPALIGKTQLALIELTLDPLKQWKKEQHRRWFDSDPGKLISHEDYLL